MRAKSKMPMAILPLQNVGEGGVGYAKADDEVERSLFGFGN